MSNDNNKGYRFVARLSRGDRNALRRAMDAAGFDSADWTGAYRSRAWIQGASAALDDDDILPLRR